MNKYYVIVLFLIFLIPSYLVFTKTIKDSNSVENYGDRDLKQVEVNQVESIGSKPTQGSQESSAKSAIVLENFKLVDADYLTFQIPNSWECAKFDIGGYECFVDESGTSIIMMAHPREEGETIDMFRDYLNNTKVSEFEMDDGSIFRINSIVKSVKNKEISGQKWIDAYHFESELPEHFTRYLATTSPDIAAVFSMTVSSENESGLKDTFAKVAGSLKLK